MEDLARMPDDGNWYEVVEGALFVTPGRSLAHQYIMERLHRQVYPYVDRHLLGFAFGAGGDVHFGRGSMVIPDIIVIPYARRLPTSWKAARKPILIVECVSTSTEWRDRGPERDLYRKWRVADYWIVDRWERTVTVVRPDEEDRVVSNLLEWRHAGAPEPLTIDLEALFAGALDG